MLSLETTDAFGVKDEKIVVSDAELVEDQNKELQSLFFSRALAGLQIVPLRGEHGKRVLRFPQGERQIQSMKALIRYFNDERTASAPSVDGEKV